MTVGSNWSTREEWLEPTTADSGILLLLVCKFYLLEGRTHAKDRRQSRVRWVGNPAVPQGIVVRSLCLLWGASRGTSALRHD